MNTKKRNIKRFFSGEWMLENNSNGGFIVLFRTLWIALPIYLAAIALVESLHPLAKLEFDASEFGKRVSETIPWLGAVIGAVYAGLYARFSSQWQYLADLYNLQVQFGFTEEAQKPQNKDRWDNWRAAFIEDAYTLHLACKPMFATAICQMLTEPGVQASYRAGTADADRQLQNMKARFERRGLFFDLHSASPDRS